MSEYYNAIRAKNLYEPGSVTPYKLSRSRIENFIRCPKCFYIDRRLGVETPPSYPFTLNSAVDTLLKKEFDLLRKNGEAHPLMKKYGIDAIPAEHEMLDKWRTNFTGVQYLHKPTNLFLFGAIDDLWINPQGEYIIVDYKATSTNEEIIALDKDWHKAYKRQMEIYQWLARHNELTVSNTGYFVYCNGNKAMDKFDGKLEFDITIIPYEGNDDWIEDTIKELHICLNSDNIPEAGEDCQFCQYREGVKQVAGNI